MACSYGGFEGTHFQLSRLPIFNAHVEVLNRAQVTAPTAGKAFFGQRKALMWQSLTTTGESQAGQHGRWAGKYRSKMVLAMVTAVLTLGACGGGDDPGSAGNFNIGVTVGGQFVSRTPVSPGVRWTLPFVRASRSFLMQASQRSGHCWWAGAR
jgi:hypothetical protein